MCQLSVPADVSWELLVVDNNSTDNTQGVLKAFQHQLPLRVLVERQQGLSKARNCAISATRGDLLVWTDDDVLVDPGWLAAYVKAAVAFPEASIFGGEIEPWFEEDPPAWLKNHAYQVGGVYAIRHASDYGTLITSNNYPFGANMAFRAGAQKEFLYNPNLGRCGLGMKSGDETDVIRRMLRRGHSGVWVPDACVKHYIIPERMRPKYVYGFARGLSEGNAVAIEQGDGTYPFPRWAVRRWLESTAIRLLHSPVKNQAWIRALQNAAAAHGVLSAWHLSRRSGGKASRLTE
ncbi:putative glycosyl transferase [Novipirellula aureliae]|uniref:Putative glycosyl transferase n=2 Tax=Novipirellula aureliae TaxID=2527966 RepID=A0A5C6E3T5_9BACT|nr:putative glycosyl transferase [Novipirellula aureliae]